MLEPEIPNPLSDGDIITFGKSVGRNEEIVRPVVARVHLLHSGPSTSTIKPLVVPDSSPSVTNRSHSGRYGLHSPSSSSSDEAYNGQSDSYSDVEEIPPPPPVAPAPVSQPESQSQSQLGRAFEVLKRLLPPTSIPSVPAVPPQRDPSPRLEEQSPIHSESSSPSSSLVSPSDLPPWWSLPANRPSPFPLLPRYPSISDIDLPDNFFDLPPINLANVLNDGDRSRSESPMDLASPSPPPPEQELPIIGAWADYSSSSASESEPIATPPDNEVPVASNNDVTETPAVVVNQAAVEHEGNHEAEPVATLNENSPSSSSAVNSSDKGKQKEAAVDPFLFVTRAEYEELKGKYSNLQTEIETLQAQRRKYKSKFNANVHTVTDKFHELENKMNDMTAQCNLVMDQMENVTSGEVCFSIDLHYPVRLNAIRNAEMKALRAETEREIEAERETLRQLREAITQESAPSTPHKRKRNVDDEGDRDNDSFNNSHAHTDEPPAEVDVPMHPVSSHPCGVEFEIHHRLRGDRPSPRKRARKFVSVAAQTATAVTMGAVAAWVALAFS
ncbi:hypothetical protein AN958_01941 [Leucoagaricus sp. SymC.cos]|nr:hypothetical protein AN958_01941 [Leucoagaricus sp. SymC.cos]